MTKQEILEAAAQIISEKGFHAASMADIAEAVDLRKASLYHHIASKQEILVELLDQALDLLIERITAVVEQDLPPKEKFKLAMREYLDVLVEHGDLAAVLLLEHRSLEPDMRKRHIPRRDKYEALWRGIIEEGVAQGVFVCDDPRLAVKAVLGIANWTIMWYSPNGSLTPREIADRNADLILNGFISR